jgi:cell division transport system ATP-binding protein
MVNGKDITHLKHRQVAEHRRGIGCVFQDFRLLKEWNVYENVAFAQKVVGVPNRLIGRNVHKILALVGLEDKVNAYPRELSGGEQQRVALARALVNEPAMLIADEPTGNLDPKNSIEIMNLLDTINKQGTTVIVVTHNHEIVNSMKKRVITLHKGELIKDEIGGTYRQETDVRPDLIQTIEQEVKEMDSVQETPVAEPLYSAEEPVLEEEEQQIPEQEGIEVKLDDTTSWVEAFEEKDKEEVLYSPLELAMRRGRKNRS